MQGLVKDDRDFTERYNTQLTPEQETAFQLWALNLSQKYGKNVLNDLYDYDMRGAFLEGLTPDGNLHWNDAYKKPNHPTFSNESKYDGVDGFRGGKWTINGDNVSYEVSPTNVYSRQELEQYRQQVEPKVQFYDNR